MKTRPNMRDIVFSAKHLRGAQLVEGKRDIRYYLCGICLNKDGMIYGTNGHMAYRVPHPPGLKLKENVIVQLESAIPAGMNTAKLEFIDCTHGIVSLAKDVQCIEPKKHIYFKVIDSEKYPDMNKAFDHGKPFKATKELGLSHEYMALAQKVFPGGNGVLLKFAGDHSPITVSSPHSDHEGAELLIMPMRIR